MKKTTKTTLIALTIGAVAYYLSKKYWGVHKSDEASDTIATTEKGAILKKMINSDEPINVLKEKINQSSQTIYGKIETVTA